MRRSAPIFVPLSLALLFAAGACSDDVPAEGGSDSPMPTSLGTEGSSSESGETSATDPSDTDPSDTDTDPSATDTDSDTDTGGEAIDCEVPAQFDPSDTSEWLDGAEVANVSIDDRDSCLRTYSLSTTAPLRDNLPANPRAIVEDPEQPRLRSGHDLFDALYALAVEETKECSVSSITDGAFNLGGAVPCGAEGCFETGRKWKYVWTRDTAYATDLGLADLDPPRARNSLRFKLSERRAGGDRQIVQDTGTGGSYPISTDRVTWAFGARAVLAALHGEARAAFAQLSFEALRNTALHDRGIAYDPSDGLYRGEQSFLDWREQSYPAWTADDVVHIGQSKSLSTNVAHLEALELLTSLAAELDEPEVLEWAQAWASELRAAIHARLWLPEEGQYSSHVTTGLDPAPTRRFDLLGLSLAILKGVPSNEQALQILSGYPHYGPGVPVLWPQQQFTPIYHNRGEWPFVTAYWLRAAAHAGHDAVASKMIRALIRGAALNLSNMENFEAQSGAAWVEEGDTSGPVVNSQRQLWSVAAYVSMVHQVLFGLEPVSGGALGLAGLRAQPFIPAELRDNLFGGTSSLVLNDYPYRGRRITVVLELPDSAGTGALELGGASLDGQPVDPELIDDVALVDGARLVLELLPGAGAPTSLTTREGGDYREVFGPRTPWISGVSDQGGQVRISIDIAGENPDDISLRILRDGALVADALPGGTASWTDPDSDTSSGDSPCYTLEATYLGSGNHSQHAAPACWWGPGAAHITTLEADALVNVGGQASNNWGRFHYEGWGAPGDTLTAPSFTPSASGTHLIQAEFGNGSGSINTGITCAVKRVRVERVSDDVAVGEGILMMPHLGTWDRWEDSNFVPVELEAGVEYRMVVFEDEDSVNMSVFDHFSIYTGGNGGVGGAYNFVNIAALKLFAKPE